MKTYTANIEIEGQGYGEFTVEAEFIRGQLFPPDGQAYFCADCGRIWAKISVETRKTRAVTIPCKQHHASIHWPGGSIWLDWERQLMQRLPPEALAYEGLRMAELLEEIAA